MQIVNEHIINHIQQKGTVDECLKLELIYQLREMCLILTKISGTIEDIERRLEHE